MYEYKVGCRIAELWTIATNGTPSALLSEDKTENDQGNNNHKNKYDNIMECNIFLMYVITVPLRKKSKSESVSAIDGSIVNARRDHYVDDLEMEKLILEEESDVEVIEDSAIVRNSRKRKANGKSK
ncbi:unnamed protein product, partial [Allacma fusca]